MNFSEEVLQDISKLCHLLPSPTRVTAIGLTAEHTTEDAFGQLKGLINQIAQVFVRRVLDIAIVIMQHFCRTTMHPAYISHALEIFIEYDDNNEYDHSTMTKKVLQDIEEAMSRESNDSEWEYTDGEDEDGDAYNSSSDINEGGSTKSDDEDSGDGGEESHSNDSYYFEEMQLLHKFDDAFEPVAIPSLSDEDFLTILEHDFHCYFDFKGGSGHRLKNAMFSYIVAKVKKI